MVNSDQNDDDSQDEEINLKDRKKSRSDGKSTSKVSTKSEEKSFESQAKSTVDAKQNLKRGSKRHSSPALNQTQLPEKRLHLNETCDQEEVKNSRKLVKKKNRCLVCRKKVGLTGLTCRCSGLFCAFHRYSDRHNCSFDYRAEGAAEIRRNNPVIIREKIQKI